MFCGLFIIRVCFMSHKHSSTKRKKEAKKRTQKKPRTALERIAQESK